MAYLSVPKISRHLIFLHLSSPFIVDNCSYTSILSFAITYLITYTSASNQKPASFSVQNIENSISVGRLMAFNNSIAKLHTAS